MAIIYRLVICVLCVVTFPLQCIVGIYIAFVSGLPILFRQKRVGKDGRIFMINKFRTMVIGSERRQRAMVSKNESSGPTFKIHNDPRFTRIGKFLSHTGLDELPQVFNVLHGDMALIGPRPLPVSEAEKLKPWMQARERVLPGIISPAILTGGYHKNFIAWMKSDVAYAKEKNVYTDMVLLIRMIPFLFGLVWREIIRPLK